MGEITKKVESIVFERANQKGKLEFAIHDLGPTQRSERLQANQRKRKQVWNEIRAMFIPFQVTPLTDDGHRANSPEEVSDSTWNKLADAMERQWQEALSSDSSTISTPEKVTQSDDQESEPLSEHDFGLVSWELRALATIAHLLALWESLPADEEPPKDDSWMRDLFR